MLGVLLADIFHFKMIYQKYKLGQTPLMLPLTGHKFALEVAILVEALRGQLVGQQSCLQEIIHSTDGHDTDESIVGNNAVEVVLEGYFPGDAGDLYPYLRTWGA